MGTARGRIVIDNSDAIRASKQAEAAQAGVFTSAQRGLPVLSRVSTGMALVGAAAVAGFGFAVKTAADFEKGLSAVAAVSGASREEMEALRAKALQLGKDTKFSAAEAVGAMEELAKAGVSTTDILSGAADATVALAAAGEVDLARAAEIASNAMNVFNLEASQMPHVADQIAGAANASAISVDEFAQSLQQSGAAAQLAGVTFEDLTTAIALMGNAGIKGSDAGTSLKTMLLNLNPTTKKQKDLMRELGIVTAEGANRFFDAQGNAKGLADIAGVLGGALQGMTRQQKLATLETLFGSDAIRAAAVIADAGAKGFNDLAANIGKVKAADVAAKRMDNLAGSIEQFKGSLETALIQVGAPAQAGLRSLVDGATRLVNAFSNLSPSSQKLIGQLVVFGGLALLISAGLIKMFIFMVRFGEAIQTATKLVQAFGVASKLAFLTNPVFLVIAAVVALIAILVLLYKRNETVRNFINAAWQGILGVVRAVVSFFAGLPGRFSSWLSAIGNFFVSLWQRIVAVWQAAPAFFGRVVQGIISFIQQLPGRIAFFIGFIIGRWLQFQIRMYTIAIQLGARVLSAIIRFFSQLPGRIAGFVASAFVRWVQFQVRMVQTAVRIGTQVLQAIVRFFSQLPGRVASFVTSTVSRFVSLMAQLPARARAFAGNVVSAVTSGLAALPGVVSGAVGRAISAFQGMIGRAFAAAKSLASSLWNGFKAGLFGSPRTLIEYAMIGMNRGFARELARFEGQQASFARVAAAFTGREIALSNAGLAAGVAGRSTTVNQIVNITGVRDPEQVKTAMRSASVLRPISQAARARGA